MTRTSTQAAAQLTVERGDRHQTAGSLLAHSRRLRAEAATVNPVLADAYMRRAAELRLEAWARAVRSTPIETDSVEAAIAAA